MLLVAYVCLFNGLTAFGLVGPDEPRYASVARDMAAGGDWVTPRLHGQPWLEKPILYYWVAALGYRVFGDGELAARLPSVLGALTTMLALGWVAWRFYGPTTATLFAWSSRPVSACSRSPVPPHPTCCSRRRWRSAMQMQDASLRLGELRRVIVLRRVSEEAVLVLTGVGEDGVNQP